MNKICIASSGLGHVARGIEAWADDLAGALADRGEDVILCKGAGEPQRDIDRVVPCWTRDAAKTRLLVQSLPAALGWRIGMGSGYAVEQTTFARNLIKVLQTEDVDVLHVQDPFVALQVQKALRRGRVKTRTILAHGTEEPLEFQRRITYLQHLAPWHHRQARQAGLDRDSWTTIPNFIDTDHFRPGSHPALREELGIPPDARVVLVAAAIKRKHKRIDYVVNEFRTLLDRHPDLPAWLVVAGGHEPETDALIATAKALLGDRIRFLVRFPRVRMADLYRTADVFSLGSLKEMMPIALLEATASGLPCVVHRHPVMQWMVGAGGRAIDLSTPGNLAAAWAEWLADPYQSRPIGRAARRHCCDHFSTEVVVDQILRYYRQVCDDRRLAA
ncbi:glycosyltransferase family 4 protein [Rhodopirellula sp. JC639]|uniref:glycosyltransferase family 4 protein n=1 Tax=Stieleria mannarensis TaxID=2755585 RepID=UPI00160406AE|nr:glycosyltransferase family 4 protein [Rhodopirellula sp. JC639]